MCETMSGGGRKDVFRESGRGEDKSLKKVRLDTETYKESQVLITWLNGGLLATARV